MAVIIIGLLVAGITSSSTLLEGYKLNRIASDMQKYRLAFHNFKEKYDALPGDMDEATSYFSGTANGNGDGIIDKTIPAEVFDAWQHLSLADMVDGNFDGTGAGSSGKMCTETACPTGPFNVYYFFRDDDNAAGVDLSQDNFLFYGGYNGDNFAVGPVITSFQAYHIDKKIDDGQATQGFLWASTGSCVSSGEYVLTNDADVVCSQQAYQIEKRN